MKKRLLCMILCAVLVAGLAMPAFAEGEGETRSGFIIGENFYDYATPVSGDGWSYDGNYRITFSGISLATPDYPYTNYTSFQFCNPPCDLTVVLADGTSSSFNSFETMYRIGKASVDAAKITFEGGGALTCHQFVIGPVEGAPGFFEAAGICSPGLSAQPVWTQSWVGQPLSATRTRPGCSSMTTG